MRTKNHEKQARLVAHEYTIIKGIDFEELFTPVTRLEFVGSFYLSYVLEISLL